jgi:hypothetical protein
VFVWTSDTTTADDGATVIVPTGIRSGCWKRVFDSTYNVQWFGAKCDGSTDDTSAFNAALGLVNSRNGGTIVIPAGRTCLVTQLNLGAVGSPAAPASGITIRGAQSESSSTSSTTILVQPSTASSTACSLASSSNVNGGIVMGPNVNNVNFEDITLKAGSNLKNCLVNASENNAGDIFNVHFHRVFFLGNGSTTDSDLYMGYDSYFKVDNCRFAGALSDIKMDSGPYLNNTSITDSLFYSLNNAPQTAYEIAINGDAEGLHVAGNAFEYVVNGINVAGLRGGDITGNWFNGEGIPNPSNVNGTFINVSSYGCTIADNQIVATFSTSSTTGTQLGINVAGSSANVIGNHSNVALTGNGIVINANGSTVANNRFDGGTAAQSDIVVNGGVGYSIGPNHHNAPSGYSMQLAATTRGFLFYDSADDSSVNKVNDLTLAGSGPGGWTKSSNAVFKLPADTSDTAHLIVDNLAGMGGGTLNLETASGQNSTLVLNDPVSGGAYGSIQIKKTTGTAVNIAGGSLAGPTYFNVPGDSVGIGTAAPNAKLEVNGGIRLNTTTSQPSCASTTDGLFWVVQGASGVKDTVQVCAKDASNSYAWRTLY